MKSESITREGRRTRFWRGGAGSPMVLLHGGMGEAALHWSRVWDRLGQTHEVFAPDLPGFGETAALPRVTYAAFVDWLAGFHEAVGVQQSTIVGVGFGASVARTYSATFASRCRSLVMINGGELPGFFGRLGARLTPGPGSGEVDPARLFSRDRLASMVGDPDLLTDDFVRACQANAAITPILRKLDRGPAPRRNPFASTLVLWGEADRVTPPETGRQVAADMPGAAFRLLRGCGHLPPIEAPEETAEALFAFLG